MIIDSHTHVRKNKGDIKDFLNGMDANGIDMAIVHPIVPSDDAMGLSDNEFVGELVQRYPDRLMGYACVIPTEEDAPQELRAAVEKYGFKGLKLHPPLQNFSMLDPRVGPVIETCIDLDIPILIHTGPIYSHAARMEFGDSIVIDDLAIRYPEAKFIIAHGNPFGNDPVLVAKHPNVYMDTTIVFSQWVNLFPQLGPAVIDWMRTDDRIMFGTDANPLNPARFALNLDPIKKLDLSEERMNKLLCGNIKRLLKLE
ncbi:MAG: amidohydrolase family protein [Eubacteriales bacterium]|nr:amidohydrolase family protein [Eubacteriales bacterium]